MRSGNGAFIDGQAAGVRALEGRGQRQSGRADGPAGPLVYLAGHLRLYTTTTAELVSVKSVQGELNA
jgi:hypothetical protein